MLRVLIVAENLQQYERLKLALSSERNVHITVANLRQLNSKNMRVLRQMDLIVLEDTQELSDDHLQGEALLSFLKKTGLPAMILPATIQGSPFKQTLQVLNLTEQRASQGSLSALLKKIHTHYSLEMGNLESAVPVGLGLVVSDSDISLDGGRPAGKGLSAPENPVLSSGIVSSQIFNSPSKMTHTLSIIRRISDQLREPLSNMNLAIHMLGRVQSIEERDRYLRLLREEYNRELQLLNQLDNHLETNLPRTP